MRITQGSINQVPNITSRSSREQINSTNTNVNKNAKSTLQNITLGNIDHLNIKLNEHKDNVGFDLDYLSMFDDNVSIDDITQNGINENARNIYDDKAKISGNANYYKSIDERFKESAKKYDVIANKIKEIYGENAEEFEFEMRSLNKAFESENTNAIIMQRRKSFGGLLSGMGQQSEDLSKKITSKFIEKYNSGETADDVGQTLQNIFKESLPKETTSLNNISYKDYEIINKARKDSFGKTGIDVLKSLSENKDLSEILRNEYKRLLNSNNIYGLTFNKNV